MGGTMSARAVEGIIKSVQNRRNETIEVGFIITVIEQEHVYGTGQVRKIVGEAGGIHFAAVEWEDGRDREWLTVDELTNINLNQRDRTLYGGETA
jgi:hypothetical protein